MLDGEHVQEMQNMGLEVSGIMAQVGNNFNEWEGESELWLSDLGVRAHDRVVNHVILMTRRDA
jgi:hypothetical protein